MDQSNATRFFFGKKVLKESEGFSKSIDHLYLTIQRNKHEDQSLSQKAAEVGNDGNLMRLAEICNMDIDKVSDMNLNLSKRMLYAWHINNARTLKSRQNERASR